MPSYSSAFSSPLGAIHNSHPSTSTSILSLFKSSPKSSSSNSSKNNSTNTTSTTPSFSVEILPSTSTSTYTSNPPTYHQAIGQEENLSLVNEKNESKKDLELRRKEEKRAAKALKLIEADARMDQEFRRLGF